MFNPKTEYDVVQKSFPIRDFSAYRDEFVVRPPYQRKTVWGKKKQQAMLDSLFRRYYVPRIVIRLVRLSDEKTVMEVIDGQQRITTAQLFFSDELPLPTTLESLDDSLAGTRYSQLPPEMRRFVDRELKYEADVIKAIDDPKNPEHQRIASDIFWRLQQGESLTYMEIAHARLSSLSRNFVVKYGDDLSFDYEKYRPVDDNIHKHRFFRVIDRGNLRMQHLALLTRFLILEETDGPADIKDTDVMNYIDRYQASDGIDNLTFEDEPHAKAVLKIMNSFYSIFENDPMVDDENGGLKELRIEYYIISVFLLLRHLIRYYVFDHSEKEIFRQFVLAFHERWRARARKMIRT